MPGEIEWPCICALVISVLLLSIIFLFIIGFCNCYDSVVFVVFHFIHTKQNSGMIFIGAVKAKNLENQIISKSLVARKPKGMNKISKMGYDYLCLREMNFSFINIYIIFELLQILREHLKSS